MHHRPECHGIRDLTVEPDVLVGREQPCKAWSDHADDIAQHGNEDEASIKREHKTGTTRCPHRPLQAVESSQLFVRSLWCDVDA